MVADDFRFYVSETLEEEVALARARVRERREGLKLTTAVFGGLAVAGAVFALAAHLGGGALQLLLPALLVLVVIPSAGLALVNASSLLWRWRLRRLTGGREPDEALSLFPDETRWSTSLERLQPAASTPARRETDVGLPIDQLLRKQGHR